MASCRGGGVGFLCWPGVSEGRETMRRRTGGHIGTKAWLYINFSLEADIERERECLLILATHVL